ncbi:MAG: glycosyltransferase [Ginsengibacter sp.]
MRIAVNAASLEKHRLETFVQLASFHPEHEFLFFANKEFNPKGLPKNISLIEITPPENFSIQWKIWNNIKLPSLLKKNKADVFVSKKFVTSTAKVPQILIQPDFSFLHNASNLDKKEISFYKKNVSSFLEKSDSIVVNSNFLKNEIENRYKIASEKISVIYPSLKNRNAVNFEERELIKEKYAEGNEYFIYKGIISTEKNLVNLLKAFSVFKKRQRSKMQLLILGSAGKKFQEFVHSLDSYKFKKDVKLLNDVAEKEGEKILASAYAMVYVPVYECEGLEVIKAMKSTVPLVVSDISFLKEYCNEAALYVSATNINDIAEKMMLLFKDEQKRKELIEKGEIQIEKFSKNSEVETLFDLIQKHGPVA